ncbi:MAG: hypothetical protein S4CHLAM45_13920 [Chlamydiales bacterium]|nr:hypothetical protein [Chlamydiales bacterium]MCH9620497.1 hypothetical protein [Chlamydiales bacterium]MCH9623482.1 hypothetical protein [Chlamydiales bacterium]
MKLPVYRELSKKEQCIQDLKKKALAYWKSNPKDDLKRIEKTKKMMARHLPKLKRVIDIGAGRRLFQCDVAIDIAADVLDGCQFGVLPYLNFPDHSFEGVILTDVLAELPEHLFRLALSEVARILEPEGHLICSTSLEKRSYDAKERFLKLIQTEFDLVVVEKSRTLFFFSERHVVLIGRKRTF